MLLEWGAALLLRSWLGCFCAARDGSQVGGPCKLRRHRGIAQKRSGMDMLIMVGPSLQHHCLTCACVWEAQVGSMRRILWPLCPRSASWAIAGRLGTAVQIHTSVKQALYMRAARSCVRGRQVQAGCAAVQH